MIMMKPTKLLVVVYQGCDVTAIIVHNTRPDIGVVRLHKQECLGVEVSTFCVYPPHVHLTST